MSLHLATVVAVLSLYSVRFVLDAVFQAIWGRRIAFQWTRVGADFGFIGMGLIVAAAIRASNLVTAPSSLYTKWGFSATDAIVVVLLTFAAFVLNTVLYALGNRGITRAKNAPSAADQRRARRLQMMGSHVLGYASFAVGILSL